MQNSKRIAEKLNIIDDILFQKMAEDKEFCEEMISTILEQNDNHVKRVRYNTSCITANITEPGSRFENVPNVIGIFISKFDVFEGGKTVYHIERVIRETDKYQDNGLQEIYVNTKIDDGTDISELMKIFTNQELYDFKKFPKISARKKQFLSDERGEERMCELVDNYLKEIQTETIRKLFEKGVSYEVVKASVDLFTDEELNKIYEQVRLAS